MYKIKYIFIIISILISLSPDTAGKIVVVIDPGHGGHDSGAVGKNFKTKEKDINLGVALALYNSLKNNPKFKPILTRKDDTFIPLEKRSEISNYFKADVFISIHCNNPAESSNTHTNGSEVYYLEESKVKNTENQRKSVLIAYKILNELQSSLAFTKRQILPANFSVLRGTNSVSPSILIEVGYLSNYDDENYLKDSKKQEVIALAIYKSLKDHYFK